MKFLKVLKKLLLTMPKVKKMLSKHVMTIILCSNKKSKSCEEICCENLSFDCI